MSYGRVDIRDSKRVRERKQDKVHKITMEQRQRSDRRKGEKQFSDKIYFI